MNKSHEKGADRHPITSEYIFILVSNSHTMSLIH